MPLSPPFLEGPGLDNQGRLQSKQVPVFPKRKIKQENEQIKIKGKSPKCRSQKQIQLKRDKVPSLLDTQSNNSLISPGVL